MKKIFNATLLYTLAHACVDGLSVLTVFQNQNFFDYKEMFFYIMLYNTLAFAGQPFAGLILDKTNRKKEVVLFSFLLLFEGFFLPLPKLSKIILVGVGNCLFHTAAGAEILIKAKEKMWPLGVFVSTGVLGLTLATVFWNNAQMQTITPALLAVLFVLICFIPQLKITSAFEKVKIKWSFLISCALLFCISIRSFMGFAKTVKFDIAFYPLIIAFFVFAGKFIGGFLCDKWGTKKVILISVPLAAIFFFLGPLNVAFWGLAQLFVNISMPITLFLLYKTVPHRPAFIFGLAASFLLPDLFLLYFFPIQVQNWMFLAIFIINYVLLLFAFKGLYGKES